MDKLSVTVSILERTYKLNIDRKDEAYLRRAATLIDTQVREYAKVYGQRLDGIEIKSDDIFYSEKNEEGILYVKGPNVMLGYYNNPEETAKVIDEDGWFHTGDLGHVDKKGHYYISGRSKNVIVTNNGKNIYPEELEYHLGTDIRVGESIVIEDENKKGEPIVAARIFPNFEELKERYGKDENEFTDEELHDIMGEVVENVNSILPPYKKIVDFKIRRTEFVKNTTSKILRHKNKD